MPSHCFARHHRYLPRRGIRPKGTDRRGLEKRLPGTRPGREARSVVRTAPTGTPLAGMMHRRVVQDTSGKSGRFRTQGTARRKAMKSAPVPSWSVPTVYPAAWRSMKSPGAIPRFSSYSYPAGLATTLVLPDTSSSGPCMWPWSQSAGWNTRSASRAPRQARRSTGHPRTTVGPTAGSAHGA